MDRTYFKYIEAISKTVLPLLSVPAALQSGVGSMSSKPQETLCFPPSKQDGEPGPPSRRISLRGNKKKHEIKTHYALCVCFYNLVTIILLHHRDVFPLKS